MLKCADGVLDPARALADAHRVADRLDADAVDGEAPRVGRALHVGDGKPCVALVHFEEL
jgi:hypothetical protein